MLKLKERDNRLYSAMVRYTSRLFFLAISYYFLKNVDIWLSYSLAYLPWRPSQYFIKSIVASLHSDNYQSFFKYFADIYFLSCLLLVFPYFYRLGADVTISGDKYVSFMRTLISVAAGKRLHWDNYSKLGMQTILVKIFFIPFVVSWAINCMHDLRDLTLSFQWDIYMINAYLVQISLLADTAIFSTGYLTESRSLKSEIRSVEPTLLGWLVCLWCYPPFNDISFRVFDYKIIDIALKSPEWVNTIMVCVMTLLWGVYASASVALGFKASNLTNRGIVRSGPYRFVRHPAYAAKVLVWTIQGVFFSQFSLGMLMGICLIYGLRAWTEERHLSMDHDYIEYKNSVRWRFIPAVV